jgi:competence protein ComEC
VTASRDVPWRRMPVVPLAVAFGGGIAVAPLATFGVAGAAWAGAATLGSALLVLARPTAATLATLLAVVAIGVLRGTPTPAAPDHVSRLTLPRTARVEARLVDEPTRWTAERARLLVEVERVDDEPRSGVVQLTAYGLTPALAAGQRITVETRLDRPLGFRNPGTYDHATRLLRHGIAVVGTVRGERITPLEDGDPAWPARLRRRAVGAMRQALPPVSAALLAGLLLGDRTELPPDVDAAFRRAGVYHVLAVSGFNVALVATTVWALLTLARAPRRVTALGALLVVVGFATVVGAQPSVLRATLMAVLVLVAVIVEREASVLNGLALAAVAILAVRPAELHDPGFQLSFAATAGIVLAPLPRSWLLGGLAVSGAAQLAVLPIGLVHFNQITTLGVLANLVVVPLAGLATVLGLSAVAAGLVSLTLAGWLFAATWPILLMLRGAVAIAARVPGAVVHAPAPGAVAIVCYVAALALGLAAWRLRDGQHPRARWLAVAAGVLAIASVLATLWPALRPADGRLRITVLDVGQGDAIVVEGPHGRVLLVDAGAGGPYRLDAGERVVAPFLWNRGVLRLTAAVVTHADADHAGGMGAVRERFSVSEGWDGAVASGFLALDGALVAPLAAAAAGRNDAARVLRVDFGLFSILLASDVESAGERALTAGGAPLGATVLKVPHHGSRTSSGPALLAAVRPSVAVVSVGRNLYGHPDSGVLARLAAAGADVYRTDHDGAILLETDGRSLTVTRWASRTTVRYCLDPETTC